MLVFFAALWAAHVALGALVRVVALVSPKAGDWLQKKIEDEFPGIVNLPALASSILWCGTPPGARARGARRDSFWRQRQCRTPGPTLTSSPVPGCRSGRPPWRC